MRQTIRILTVVACFAALSFMPGKGHAQEALEGVWQGSYECRDGSTRATLTITPRDGTAFDGRLAFSNAAARGEIAYLITSNRGRITMRAQAWIRQPPGYRMADISARLDPATGIIEGRVNAAGCRRITLHRGEASGQQQAQAQPRTSPEPQARTAQRRPSRPGAQPAADAGPVCKALSDWAAQMTRQHSDLRNLTAQANRTPGAFAPLLQDRRFTPHFGMTFDQLSDDDARRLTQQIRDCGAARALSEETYTLVQIMLFERHGRGRGIREARDRANATEGWLDAQLAALAPSVRQADGIEAMRALATETKARTADFWPEDRKAIEDRIARQGDAFLDWLIRASAGDRPRTRADLEALDDLATALGEPHATRLRAAVDGGIERLLAAGTAVGDLTAFGSYPALRKRGAGTAAAMPDRMVWSGRYSCGPTALVMELAVMGDIKTASRAVVLVYPDPAARGINIASPISMEYAAAYDGMLDRLKLTLQRQTVRGTGMTAAREIELSFEADQNVARGYVGQGCNAVALERRSYPPALESAATRLRQGMALRPQLPLARATDEGQFCLAAAAWAADIKRNAGDRNLTRIGSDKSSQLFLASIFDTSFAAPYLGIELDALRHNLVPMMRRIQACGFHPLFFEYQPIFQNILYNGLNTNSRWTEARRTITQARENVERIARASDRFSEDIAGFTRLRDYIVPLEKELDGLVPKTRDALVAKAKGRLTEIAFAVLRTETSAPADDRAADRLTALDEVLRTAREGAGMDDAAARTLAAGAALISRHLAAGMEAERDRLVQAPATLEGLVRFGAGRKVLADTYGKLSAYPPYRPVMAALDRRGSEIEAAAVAEIAGRMPASAEIGALRAVRDQVQAAQKALAAAGGPTAAIWRGYYAAMEQWFAARNQDYARRKPTEAPAPSGPAGTTDPLGGFGAIAKTETPRGGSAFTSPDLKEKTIVDAVRRRDFTAIYDSQNRATTYLMHLMGGLNSACPGLSSGDMLRAVIRRQLGDDVLSSNRDAATAAGLNLLMKQLQGLAEATRNPGQWIDRTISHGEFVSRAEADAGVIIAATPCNSPEMKSFVENVETFFNDPTVGVPIERLSMGDVCRRGQRNGRPEETRKYCGCAGPILESRLTAPQKTFIKNDPRENFWPALELLPATRSEIGKCAI